MTILNPSDGEVVALKSLGTEYLIYQHEICPETGTPHLHAFCYYKNPRIWPKRYLPRADIEVVKSIPAAIKYCSKLQSRDHGPYEFGERPEQGRRNDLEAIARYYLDTGEAEFVQDNMGTFIRYYRGLRELRSVVASRERTEKPAVFWVWGSTGTGKSHLAFTHSPGSCYIKDGTMWWNGYAQQQVILIDDFDGRWPYRDLLRLLDKYPYQGQIKGSYVEINSPVIYITCEFPPDHYWEENALEQVIRRLNKIIHKNERFVEDI